MNSRGYWSGLLAGGIIGAFLGMLFVSRNQPYRKLLTQDGEMGVRARKVWRGLSRGMGDMLRR